MLWLPVLLLLGIGSFVGKTEGYALASEEDYDDDERRTVADLEELIKTGKKSESLRKLPFNNYLINGLFDRTIMEEPNNLALCTLCKAAARVLINYRRLGGSRQDAIYAANKICVEAKIASENVCKGAIDLNIDIFLYIIDYKEDLQPATVCSILAQPYGCQDLRSHIRRNKWSVQIPERLSEVPQPVLNANTTPLRILQITDIHYDDIYTPGGNAECGEPLCCGSNQGVAENEAAKAGYWGDYRNCDPPMHAVLDLMKQLKNHQYDYVYFTGDVVNHRVWETSAEKNTQALKAIDQVFKSNFHVPTYSILGNHEPSPLDAFAENITDPNLSSQWLFDLAAAQWSKWLPQSSLETIKKGGFYTTLIKPGFRLVALNSNIGYTYNWWLMYNDVDPFGQLQWLSNTLAAAEKAGEIVHILSHVPTGDDTCLIKWSHEYNKIINRFHDIIAVQFNGHTHYDEFNVFYSKENIKKPINVVYNGGSVTSYSKLNPNYRIYTVNPTNYKVMDFDEYTFNLTAANLAGSGVAPSWYKLYSFKEAWGVKDMTDLSQIDKVVRKIASDKNSANQYWRFKVREGDPYMQEGCNDKCQKTNICRLVTTEYRDNRKCDELLETSYLRHFRLF